MYSMPGMQLGGGGVLQQKDYKSAAAFSLTLLLMTQYAAMIKTLCLSEEDLGFPHQYPLIRHLGGLRFGLFLI